MRTPRISQIRLRLSMKESEIKSHHSKLWQRRNFHLVKATSLTSSTSYQASGATPALNLQRCQRNSRSPNLWRSRDSSNRRAQFPRWLTIKKVSSCLVLTLKRGLQLLIQRVINTKGQKTSELTLTVMQAPAVALPQLQDMLRQEYASFQRPFSRARSTGTNLTVSRAATPLKSP